mmetsp:Transcript_14842/g.34869  ORF Transcript_14842/g.34869 Transcript_14842/m.34869 type:complete len:246 (+) Transcript_14842:66-803(+)
MPMSSKAETGHEHGSLASIASSIGMAAVASPTDAEISEAAAAWKQEEDKTPKGKKSGFGSSHSFPPYVYDVPLEVYYLAYNSRFPTHKLFPYLINCEVLSTEEEEDHQGHGRYTHMKRRIEVDIAAPKWFKKLTGLSTAFFIEEHHVYHDERRIVVLTVNESFATKATSQDESIYEVDPTNPNRTIFTEKGTATIRVPTLGLKKKLEEYLLGTFKSRYDEARETDKLVIAELLERDPDLLSRHTR